MNPQEKGKKNPFRVIFKQKISRVWFIVGSFVIVLLILLSSIIRSNTLSTLLDMTLGGDRAISRSGSKVVDTYKLDDGAKDKKSAKAFSDHNNETVCEEGIVLLKNKDKALPISTKEKKKVTVFGKNSVNLALTGSGSASSSNDKDSKSVYDSLEAAGFEINPTMKSFYENDSTIRSANPGMDDGGAETLDIGETPVSQYTSSVTSSFSQYNDLALIVLTRIGGEGFDLPRSQPGNSEKTFLDLYDSEREMIQLAEKSGFQKIILVLNAANQINCTELEQDDKIDGILWVGFPGSTGIMALGRILNGEVNPSGHLVDTYVKDFHYIPSYYNFGNNGTADGDRFINGTKKRMYYFVDYEEGIYVGYRYFETGYQMKGEDWYNKRVLYPFGYGLSYTNFEWTLKNKVALQTLSLTKDPFDVEVEVKNVGTVSGKDAVELYMEAPYSDNGIEKASKVLVGFAKTKMIEPGESDTATISVDPYSFASYDDEDKNQNGFTGYELEKGEYSLYIAHTAHDSSLSVPIQLGEDIRFEDDPVTGYKVENHFEDTDVHLQEEDLISRATDKTFDDLSSLTPTEEDRTVSDELMNQLLDKDWIDPANPSVASPLTLMPTYSASNGMALIDLEGKAFDDEIWDKLLDQTTLEEQIQLFSEGGFKTVAMSSINKAKTTDCDGPVGLTKFLGDPSVYGASQIACEVMTASTWNVELAEKIGEAIGNEGLIGNEAGDKMPYSGWYAPAMNIHRNPFGGRCCEYYSEDPFLSGKMGASQVKGANSKGLVTYLKHFVGNEGETHRDVNGDATFVSEQALREIYLKPFEITVKEGKAKGIMTSFNRIGTHWTGANYSLCTTVLRNEWGFHGSVITDFNTHHNRGGYMHLKPMLYAGGTLDLCSQPLTSSEFFDSTSATECNLLRNAAHETLYATVHSNIMMKDVDHYAMSYWRIVLLIVDIVIPVGVIIWGVFAIKAAYKREKEATITIDERK